MITAKQIGWRGFVVEGLFSFFLAFVYGLALFRAPSPFIHILGAISLVLFFIICRKHVVAFGNPVVTISMVVLRKIHWYLGLALTALQLCMGAVAGLLVGGVVGNIGTRIAGLASYAKLSWAGISAEALGGAILVAALLGIMSDRRGDSDGTPVTFSLFLAVYGALICAAILGSIGIINPASAFALRLFGNVSYTIAPVVGGIIGGLFYTIVVEGKSFRQAFGGTRKN